MDRTHVWYAIIGVSILSSLYYLLLNQGMWWDEAIYLGLSESVQNGYYALYQYSAVEAFRPPFFPFLLAAFGIETLFPSRVVVLLFGLASIALMYALGRRLHGREGGLVSAAVLSSFHLFLFYQAKTLTEAPFVFLFLASLFFLTDHRRGRMYTFLAGVATGLAFATRYPGGILFPIYALWLLKKDGFNVKGLTSVTAFAAGSALALIPMFLIGQLYYGSPFGMPLMSAFIDSGLQRNPWHYVFRNFFLTFGPLGLAIIAGTLMEIRKKEYSLPLIVGLTAAAFFALQGHTELPRFFVSFFPVYALLAASWWKNSGNKQIVTIALIAMAAISFQMAYDSVSWDSEAGGALRKAGEFLRTQPEGRVLSEYYAPAYPDGTGTVNKAVYAVNPWIEVLSKKDVVVFPQDVNDLANVNAQYAVIYKRDPTVPAYAAAYAEENYERLASFTERGEEIVIVYSVR